MRCHKFIVSYDNDTEALVLCVESCELPLSHHDSELFLSTMKPITEIWKLSVNTNDDITSIILIYNSNNSELVTTTSI